MLSVCLGLSGKIWSTSCSHSFLALGSLLWDSTQKECTCACSLSRTIVSLGTSPSHPDEPALLVFFPRLDRQRLPASRELCRDVFSSPTYCLRFISQCSYFESAITTQCAYLVNYCEDRFLE